MRLSDRLGRTFGSARQDSRSTGIVVALRCDAYPTSRYLRWDSAFSEDPLNSSATEVAVPMFCDVI